MNTMEGHVFPHILTDLLKGIRREPAVFLVGMLSLACSLFFLAGFRVLDANVRSVIARVAEEPRLIVFLHEKAPLQQQESLLSEIRQWLQVRDIRIAIRPRPHSQGEGTYRLTAATLEDFWVNDAGMRVEVLFDSGRGFSAGGDAELERLGKFQHIAAVFDERGLRERFEPFHAFLTSTGSWLVALLALLTLVLAFACNALSVMSRADELAVPLLLGGSRFQVFFPFYGRAIVGGIAAATISAGGVAILLDSLRWFLPGVTLMNIGNPLWETPLFMAALALGGIAVNCLGCWCSLLYAGHASLISPDGGVRPHTPVSRRVS